MKYATAIMIMAVSVALSVVAAVVAIYPSSALFPHKYERPLFV